MSTSTKRSLSISTIIAALGLLLTLVGAILSDRLAIGSQLAAHGQTLTSVQEAQKDFVTRKEIEAHLKSLNEKMDWLIEERKNKRK